MSHNHSFKHLSFLSIPTRLALGLLIVALGTMFVIPSLAQPGNPALDPPRNSHTAPLTTTVSITYDEPISTTTVTSHTFAVHGMQSGLVTKTHGVVNNNTVIVTPTQPFFPGELVYAIATTQTANITGAHPLTPTLWQFSAGEITNHCVEGFDDISAALTGVEQGSVAWGDYDSDGDLDILLTGDTGSTYVTEVWRNDGGGSFSQQSTAPTGNPDRGGDWELEVSTGSAEALALAFPLDYGYLLAFPTITPMDGVTVTAQDLADVLLYGSGINAFNVTFNGANSMAGKFTTGSTLGYEEGIILSSGAVADIDQVSSDLADSDQGGGYIDADLNALFTNPVQESVALEFDFIPTGDTATFRYRFGSEEYPEYISGDFNDVFSFFINGTNYALVPGTATYVSVSTVNHQTNSAYYVDNSGGSIEVVFDGLTIILGVTAPITPNVTNHIKLVIGDGGDTAYDSAVFLEGGSFSAAALDLSKSVDNPTPNPGQLITYTLAVESHSSVDATNGLISDTLPTGLTFAGPVTLNPPQPGATLANYAGDLPTLASGVTITAQESITLTFPVTVNVGLTGGTVITNTAAVTSTEVITPVAGMIEVTVQNIAPTAAAGSDQTVSTNATVTLDGSASSDANGDALTYGWAQTGGPSVTLGDASAVSPTFTAPASETVLTFTLTITDSHGLADSTPDEVVVTVTSNLPPIADAGDDQSVTAGTTVALDGSASSDPDGNTPLTYGWAQTGGPSVTLSDASAISPTFTAPSSATVLTFTLAVTDAQGLADPTPDEVVITVSEVVTTYTYLPLVVNNYVVAPDLVVQSIMATSNGVQVVIENQGNAPVTDEFWVDVYINPNPAPTAVNQIWPDLADEGLVWGVTAAALPLAPGGVLTLTVGDAYYVAEYSQIAWPLAEGTPVYAQVDSASGDTTYGAVLESHEITGGAYNNISSTVSTAGLAGEPYRWW